MVWETSYLSIAPKLKRRAIECPQFLLLKLRSHIDSHIMRSVCNRHGARKMFTNLPWSAQITHLNIRNRRANTKKKNTNIHISLLPASSFLYWTTKMFLITIFPGLPQFHLLRSLKPVITGLSQQRIRRVTDWCRTPTAIYGFICLCLHPGRSSWIPYKRCP